MNYSKLSADPTALILGIVSVFIVLIGCCCGFLVAVSLVLGIVGLVLANKSLKEFDANPESYSIQSRKNVYAGKVLSIVGIAMSGLYVVLAACFFIFMGSNFSGEIMKKFKEMREKQERMEDSIATKKSDVEINVETDTIYSDSIQ
jgi:uncharacterized membrane protein